MRKVTTCDYTYNVLISRGKVDNMVRNISVWYCDTDMKHSDESRTCQLTNEVGKEGKIIKLTSHNF